ncbi:Kinesin-like protein KIN-12D [Lamellibrachia satsuma]|nr:Kinesin-like protein KIN-12D [Lamellibrachia satsuma]
MNIDVVGRLRAADRGEPPANLQIDKFNLVKCGRLHLTFAHLHKSEAGVCEIFNKSVEPLLDLCITGFNTCLMVVGESDSGKKELLLGDETVRNGILPILFASLFAKIGDDDTYSSYHSKVGRKLDRVQMQMVEIRGDEIIDLLDTSGRDEPLQLTETAASGVRITNLTKKQIPDVDEGSDALKCACHRSRGLRASAIIVYIHLTLLPHEKSQPNHSCFSVVILPGSENLPMDISNIDIKDVAPPMKFIFQLMQHVHELSVRRTPETIVKRPANADCTLAALLRDELGGNCKTRVFVCLKPHHDPSKIDALFRFITDLSHLELVRSNDYFLKPYCPSDRRRNDDNQLEHDKDVTRLIRGAFTIEQDYDTGIELSVSQPAPPTNQPVQI